MKYEIKRNIIKKENRKNSDFLFIYFQFNDQLCRLKLNKEMSFKEAEEIEQNLDWIINMKNNFQSLRIDDISFIRNLPQDVTNQLIEYGVVDKDEIISIRQLIKSYLRERLSNIRNINETKNAFDMLQIHRDGSNPISWVDDYLVDTIRLDSKWSNNYDRLIKYFERLKIVWNYAIDKGYTNENPWKNGLIKLRSDSEYIKHIDNGGVGY